MSREAQAKRNLVDMKRRHLSELESKAKQQGVRNIHRDSDDQPPRKAAKKDRFQEMDADNPRVREKSNNMGKSRRDRELIDKTTERDSVDREVPVKKRDQ